MEQLRDIKGIVEVSDNSLLLLILAILLMLLVFGAGGYFMKQKRRKRRRFRKTAQELAKERIEAIDYNDPKSVAYTFIEDVGTFVTEDKQKEYASLLKELKPYKYKKDVPAMDASLKEKIQHFIKEIKWQI